VPNPSVGDRYIEYLLREKPRTLGDRLSHALLLGLIGLLVVVLVGVVILANIQYGLNLPDIPGYLRGAPIAPIALIIALLKYQKRQTKEIEFKGQISKAVPVWATLVMANTALFKPGPTREVWPGLVLVTFDPALANDPPLMSALVQRLWHLKTNPSPLPEVQKAVEWIMEERPIKREGHRYRLPNELTDGVAVYAVDIFIRRAYLKDGFLTPETGRFPCLIEPDENGKIWHVPGEVIARPKLYS
jgi:hypothetical protein